MLSDSDIRERLGPLSDPAANPEPPPRRSSGAGRVIAAVFLAGLLWAGGLALIRHLERIAPRAPDSASGQINRFSDPHNTVYFTDNQLAIAYAAIGVPLIGTLGLAIYALPRRREDVG